jgi:chromatin structure-remodeling complex subunit RSC9
VANQSPIQRGSGLAAGLTNPVADPFKGYLQTLDRSIAVAESKMAPKGGTPKKDVFIQQLQAFHEQRGTSFEPEPRLPTMHGHVHVDLLKLYRAVIAKGGYDELCKVQKAWGALAQELGMHFDDNKGMGQLSFQLKQDFYRYLAAFWIKDQYNKEPPPKEILEQQSCASKNGPVLTRTVESFKLATKRPGEETPSREERSTDNTPVSGNRASGRLREAPPQRVPFQPETGPSRQTRHASSQHATPSSGHSAHPSHAQHAQHMPQHHNPNNPLHLIQAQQAALRGASSSFTPSSSENASRLSEAFEPRPQITVPLRPVNTPGNNPIEFAKRQRQSRAGALEAHASSRPVIPGGKHSLVLSVVAIRANQFNRVSRLRRPKHIYSMSSVSAVGDPLRTILRIEPPC